MYYFLFLWFSSGVYSAFIFKKYSNDSYTIIEDDAMDWAFYFICFLAGIIPLIYTLPMGAYYLHRYITSNRS